MIEIHARAAAQLRCAAAAEPVNEISPRAVPQRTTMERTVFCLRHRTAVMTTDKSKRRTAHHGTLVRGVARSPSVGLLAAAAS